MSGPADRATRAVQALQYAVSSSAGELRFDGLEEPRRLLLHGLVGHTEVVQHGAISRLGAAIAGGRCIRWDHTVGGLCLQGCRRLLCTAQGMSTTRSGTSIRNFPVEHTASLTESWLAPEIGSVIAFHLQCSSGGPRT